MTSYDLKITFANNFKRIMHEHGKNQNDIVKDLGFKQSTVSNWMNAEKYPRMDKVQILANYFGVKIIELVGKEAEEAGKSLIHRTTHLEQRYDYLMKELEIREADFYLDDIKMDEEDIEIMKTMLTSFLDMSRKMIKARHEK